MNNTHLTTRLLAVLTGLGLAFSASATVHQVGSTRPYPSPNALYLASVVQDGDTIDIDYEAYVGTNALARWTADDLLIRGVGGRPLLIANGEYLQGKGTWIIAGDNNRVENIEFSGASVPDHNGAGIRQEGIGVTIRHCFFQGNENGILTTNPGTGDILIEYCEFSANGYGDGYSHNLYIGHVGSLTFQFNYSHHANVGHNLKSRAAKNFILYNRIMDESNGNSSRLIDLPNGGFSIVMGNLLMKGPLAENKNFLGYGLEGWSDSVSRDLYFVHNTCLSKYPGAGLFLHVADGAGEVQVVNNVLAGNAQHIEGPYTVFTVNLLGSTNFAALHLVDEPSYDYHVTSDYTGIDLGNTLGSVGGVSLTPTWQYRHPAGAELRPVDSNIDIGAYEYDTTVSAVMELPEKRLRVFPNPVRSLLSIPEEWTGSRYRLFATSGALVKEGWLEKPVIDLSDLPGGTYALVLEGGRGWANCVIIR